MAEKYWVGLDVGERSTAFCAIDQRGSVRLQTTCETSPNAVIARLKELGKRRLVVVALEAGASQSLPRTLERKGFPVIVLDALKASKFLAIRHHKTDDNDAHGLAEIVRLGDCNRLKAFIRSPASQSIRDLLVLRSQLLRQRTTMKLTLRSALRKHGSPIRKFASGRGFRSNAEGELKALQKAAGQQICEEYRPLLDLIDALDAYLRRIEADLLLSLADNPAAARFTQIPGVGAICALSFYSTIENPHRFENISNVGAYLGLVPRLKQSGTTLRRSRISKAGDPMTRTHLWMAAGCILSTVKGDSALRDWGRGLVPRLGYGRARAALARKLATVMLSMWKNDVDYRPYSA